MNGVRKAQETLEKAVAQALRNGASVRAVAELGVSPNTVQNVRTAHGWPAEENRKRFYESRDDRDERENGDAWLPEVRRPHQQRRRTGEAGPHEARC